MNMPISLDDKYRADSKNIYVTGSQAIVRLLLAQRWRDERAGLNTAGFISGYRGSPMTAIDEQLWRASEQMDSNHIKFWPGMNENLAMTSVWGSQQVGYFGDAEYDGVFGMWYGKGPGLDQSMDALRQANYHGSAKHGGVLVLAGDDPCMRSTVNAYNSELLFEDLLMPVLYPANIQEVFDYGLIGIELSRYCGAWVGYKLLPETIETAASINTDAEYMEIVKPPLPPEAGQLNAFRADSVYVQETRLREQRLPAALAFARANNLNRVTHSCSKPRYGIAAMGKTWRDVLQALEDLGITEEIASEHGITILKVAMPFPADEKTYQAFASGLEEVLVVEDKREQIENGFRRACYDLPEGLRPRIVGRRDETGQKLVSDSGELKPDDIAEVIASRISEFCDKESIGDRIDFLTKKNSAVASRANLEMARMPYFCSGCPHNTSTKTPDGSRSFGGVGCHYMATWMDRDVDLFTHMGGEGATWIGQAPFVSTDHMFQNLGDGTYFHSGSLAIRAAKAAGVNITYKILYNDAVAMTGGQPVDGQLTVEKITHQMHDEDIERIAVVSDEPEKYSNRSLFASGTTFHHRRELDNVQKEMREVKGVSVLIYDQTCASEKRRRRKRGTFPDPQKRLFINNRVCEGCGDCNTQSNCISVQPVDTAFGRKRSIDQSSCNKDYSCIYGFCPSFVTVLGGSLAKKARVTVASTAGDDLPEPVGTRPLDDKPFNIVLAGAGGSGVVTIGAFLGMAAHIDGIGVSVVDQLGFAQKGGPVKTFVRLAKDASSINAARLTAGSADLLLGCDQLVAADDTTLDVLGAGRSMVVLNTAETLPGGATQNPELTFPAQQIRTRLASVVGESKVIPVDASNIATKLLGDSIGGNLFLVGYAWQSGWLPLTREAIFQTIEVNGVAIDFNKEAFTWGRRMANDPASVLSLISQDQPTGQNTRQNTADMSIDEIVLLYTDELKAYQNEVLAARFSELVKKARDAEAGVDSGSTNFARAVALNAYKLMAYKDEYEVARLYSDKAFKQQLNDQFEGDFKLKLNLAPPMISRIDKATGKPAKIEVGAWALKGFDILAKFKFLRGTMFDIFGKTAERRMERQLIAQYFTDINQLCESLTADTLSTAIEIADLPKMVRGYGHIKEQSASKVSIQRQDLFKSLHDFATITHLDPSTSANFTPQGLKSMDVGIR